jgi:hypothetical protein
MKEIIPLIKFVLPQWAMYVHMYMCQIQAYWPLWVVEKMSICMSMPKYLRVHTYVHWLVLFKQFSGGLPKLLYMSRFLHTTPYYLPTGWLKLCKLYWMVYKKWSFLYRHNCCDEGGTCLCLMYFKCFLHSSFLLIYWSHFLFFRFRYATTDCLQNFLPDTSDLQRTFKGSSGVEVRFHIIPE